MTVAAEAAAIETGNAPPLAAEGLTVAYRGRPALWNVSFAAPPDGLTAVVGPNGAGKSTLLRAALGLVAPAAGRVRLLGRPAARVRREVAYVPQRNSVDWDFPASALDVAVMGLYGRIGWFGRVRRRHRDAALAALDEVGMADLAGRQIGQLSGGQQQRVFLARALVQRPRLFLLDEPLAGIDATSERMILDALRRLERDGRHVICVHHDLETVARHFDHAALLNATLVAAGPVAEVLTEDALRDAYRKPGLAPRPAAAA